MADFRPFKAWRYNTAKVKMDKVIAPPYDVISPAGQEELYKQDIHNCIRLILNKEESSDTESNNRYIRARDFFNAWRREGVLSRDEEPCYYLYRQIFADPLTQRSKSRLALLGRLKLESFDKNIVIPHEKTLSKPRADRRRLLEATQTNFSPIFGLYESNQSELPSIYSQVMNQPYLFDAKDKEGVQHTVWAIRDSQFVQTIHKELSDKKIYIADGHHRYQTALEYAQARHQELGIPQDKLKPFDFVYMALVEFYDSGLVLLPTHRIINLFEGFHKDKTLETLGAYFDIQPCASKQDMEKRISDTSADQNVFGFILDGKYYFLKLKNRQEASKKMLPGKPDIWYQLDVNLLTHLIVSKLWNIPETQWESTIQYTQYVEDAFNRVKEGKAAAAFILRATRVEVLREMGKTQELMPQKSTYFYPKLTSGLVFHAHEE